MCPYSWTAASGAEHVFSPDDLDAMFKEAAELSPLHLRGRPFPAVLDTDFIRTGLHSQLNWGSPPKSVRSAQNGSLRLFMEYDTLVETDRKLPKFAGQLGVSVPELRRILNEDWLPHVDAVRLPPRFRELDPRAVLVRDGDGVRKRDKDDFPAASLTALLSPCLLLTHNHNHFSALGVRTREQGLEGVTAVLAIKIGEVELQAVVMVPALPLQLASAGMEWATEKIGPTAWVILGLVIAGGIYWFVKQPPERREKIKTVAAEIGKHFMEEYTQAAGIAHQGRLQLRACVVPEPELRSPISAILRELARSTESLSAAQIAELLDPSLRPSVAEIRALLRAHDQTVFRQVRHGGYVLGSTYQLQD